MATPVKRELTDADHNRGIQNAVSRFKEQREGQLLQSQLLEGRPRTREKDGGEPGERKKGGVRGALNRSLEETRLIRQELESLNQTEGIGYEAGDENLLIKNIPERPPFPGIIFSIALLKDVLDGLELTVIGVIVTTALSFLLALVLFLWTLGKVSGGWWKKKLIRKIFMKYGISIAVEFIPGLKLIPTATIFILMAHYDETKIVRLLNGALERVRRGGIKV